jgi:hypothetical protein
MVLAITTKGINIDTGKVSNITLEKLSTLKSPEVLNIIKTQDSTIKSQDKDLSKSKDSVKVLKTKVKSLGEEIAKNLMGNMSLAYLISCYIIAFIAMFVKWGINTNRAIKNNPKTPLGFKLGYWIKDNIVSKLLSIILTFGVLYLLFRFFNDIFSISQGLSMFSACLIGLFFDYAVDYLMALNPSKLLIKNLPTEDVQKALDSSK